jgi:hypothetical protein
LAASADAVLQAITIAFTPLDWTNEAHSSEYRSTVDAERTP